jgi:hypothetical protein
MKIVVTGIQSLYKGKFGGRIRGTTDIQGGFRGAGLIPMNPESVISKLDVKFKTPTPPGTSHGEPEPWTCKTPTNV